MIKKSRKIKLMESIPKYNLKRGKRMEIYDQ